MIYKVVLTLFGQGIKQFDCNAPSKAKAIDAIKEYFDIRPGDYIKINDQSYEVVLSYNNGDIDTELIDLK